MLDSDSPGRERENVMGRVRSGLRGRRRDLQRLVRRARATGDLLRAKVVTTFYRRMVLFTYDLQAAPIPVFGTRIPVRYATLTPEDAPAYRRFRPGVDAREIERRLARGDRCFVVWHGDRIMHECWVTASARTYVPYLERDIRLEPGDAYFYGAYTDAKYRGQGLYTGCYSFIARVLQQEGRLRATALVALENRPAFVVLERSGLIASGQYTFVRLGPWRRWWAAPFEGRALLSLEPARSEPGHYP
ncbi:MAG TPA: hypothetical protein VNK41_06185 [Vicinamibacterales bacterium]|nr:hypothetical protein [Vicinamibacterales bacterium]